MRAKRARPLRHVRKCKSGKKVLVNKSVVRRKAKPKKFVVRRMLSPEEIDEYFERIDDIRTEQQRAEFDNNLQRAGIKALETMEQEKRGGLRKRSRYVTKTGAFVPMTNPDKPRSGKKSKFYGCTRAQINKGYSPLVSKKICGKIASNKKAKARVI